REDHRPASDPRTGADLDRAVAAELQSDGGPGVLVAVVRVGDVDVLAEPDVVADDDGLVRRARCRRAADTALPDDEATLGSRVDVRPVADAHRGMPTDHRAGPDAHRPRSEERHRREGDAAASSQAAELVAER